MRVPPSFEPTMQHQLPQAEDPSERTIVDFPVGRPGMADAERGVDSTPVAPTGGRHRGTGSTRRGRVLVALGLTAVLVVGGGGAYAIAKLTGSGSPAKKPGDGLVGVTDTTGRLSLRVPAAWKLQTQHNKWPVRVSDAATAPALRATPDYDQFVRDDVTVPGVFAGVTNDLNVTLPPAALGSHRSHCTPGTGRPYRHGALSGQITPWTCGGDHDQRGRAARRRREVRDVGPCEADRAARHHEKILDSIQVKG